MAASKWTIKGLRGITMVRTVGMVNTLWILRKKILLSNWNRDDVKWVEYVFDTIAQNIKKNQLTTIDLWIVPSFFFNLNIAKRGTKTYTASSRYSTLCQTNNISYLMVY